MKITVRIWFDFNYNDYVHWKIPPTGSGDNGLLGAPGCFNGRPINTMDNIFRRPSWISFFSCGIWVAKSLNAAVKAGLQKKKSIQN